MTFWGGLVRGLLCPGLLCALLVGGLIQGVAAWVGARWGRRPAPPVWQPWADMFRLAGKALPNEPVRQPVLFSWPALLALVALSWATGMLPWPRLLVPSPEALPGGYVVYVVLLAAPPLARLVAAGLSAHPMAALGVRRQAPLEVARLLPLILAAAALPLLTHQLVLIQPAGGGGLETVAGVAVAAIVLLTLAWPLWDRDEYAGSLAALGGRALALFRALEMLEVSAQVGLAAVALQVSGLFPSGREWLAPVVALIAAVVVLSAFEWRRRRLPLTEAVHRYTRWMLPLAVLLVLFAWWLG